MKSRTRTIGTALAAAAALSVTLPAAAPAATKVDLRVEGASKTLFEKAVVASPATMVSNAGTSPGRHPCDVVNNGGSGPRAATPVSSLLRTRMKLGLNWYPEYTGFLVESIGKEKQAGSDYWDFWVNGKGAADLEYVGGCQLGLRKGDSVVWAITDGSQALLILKASGSASAPGVTVKATNGSTGEPVEGASVGGQATGPDGTATVARPKRGVLRLKATSAGYIRSNTVVVKARR